MEHHVNDTSATENIDGRVSGAEPADTSADRVDLLSPADVDSENDDVAAMLTQRSHDEKSPTRLSEDLQKGVDARALLKALTRSCATFDAAAAAAVASAMRGSKTDQPSQQEVFRSMCINSKQYTDRGTRIVIKMKPEPQRGRRPPAPLPSTAVLRAWYAAHTDHPYPTEEEKEEMALRCELTVVQISNWFINARRRHHPPALGQERLQREREEQEDRMALESLAESVGMLNDSGGHRLAAAAAVQRLWVTRSELEDDDEWVMVEMDEENEMEEAMKLTGHENRCTSKRGH